MGDIKLIRSGIPDLLPMQGRTKGVIHHSSVLSDLCVRLGHYKQAELDITRTQLGNALEDTLARRYAEMYPNRYIKAEEMLLGQDLPITPDLIDVYNYGPDELKLTWLSSRHKPDSEKFQRYWWQVMSQAQALGSLVGRVHVCHVNGDYKGFQVHYNVWEREFTKKELSDHETMILRHRDRMLKEGYQGEE